MIGSRLTERKPGFGHSSGGASGSWPIRIGIEGRMNSNFS
jgi:hypothetical protein